MSDSESENSIQSRCSDDELEHLGQSRASNESIKHPYTTVHSPSVELSKTSVTSVTGSLKGGIFIETPNLTSQNSLRNTPPSLTPQCSWTMGTGRGRTRVEETKSPHINEHNKNNLKEMSSQN